MKPTHEELVLLRTTPLGFREKIYGVLLEAKNCTRDTSRTCQSCFFLDEDDFINNRQCAYITACQSILRIDKKSVRFVKVADLDEFGKPIKRKRK